MLGELLGSKKVGDVLLFLFINGKGYPSQIANALSVGLTPVQHALKRLEKTSIVSSYYEGKNRIYELNRSYPLYEELESLIKKAFFLLPSEGKKNYLISPNLTKPKDSPLKKSVPAVLATIWKKLENTTQVLYVAHDRTGHEAQTAGQGSGLVKITPETPYQLIFEEEGSWQTEQGLSFNYKNYFRWTVDSMRGILAVEHLRFGKHHPVFLFHLVPISDRLLEPVATNANGEETYFGYLENKVHGLKFCTRTISPQKNESITYFYT